MRARIPPTKRQKEAIEQEARLVCSKEIERQKNDFSRRIMKLVFYSLYTEFGWGAKRANRLLTAVSKSIIEMNDDEVQWEHRDQVCIDIQKLPFERDYTELGKASHKF